MFLYTRQPTFFFEFREREINDRRMIRERKIRYDIQIAQS